MAIGLPKQLIQLPKNQINDGKDCSSLNVVSSQGSRQRLTQIKIEKSGFLLAAILTNFKID